MWTLSEARASLTTRIGEESTVFWSTADRTAAINDAQRFIASLTKGVPLVVSGSISTASPSLTVSGNIVGMHGSAGRITDGAALSMVPIDAANAGFPAWRTYVGTPKWAVVDVAESKVYFAPIPSTSTAVEVTLAVSPAELVDDNDELFSGQASMDKYLGALINYAAAMLLLRERFDGDAERFYQFALQELQMLGIDPNVVPSFKAVANGAVDSK